MLFLSSLNFSVSIKVLNPVRRGCPNFSMEWDALRSHPVPTLGTGDVPRRPNRDTLAGHPILTHEIVSHPDVSQDVPLGPESLVSIICFQDLYQVTEIN